MAQFNSKLPLKFNPTTPIQFFIKETEYIQGQGNSAIWKPITSDIYDTFYCEWRTMYGDRALTAETLGVKESATIRTFFNPIIFEKIIREQTIVVKNADSTAFKNGEPDKKNPNLYELWGGVDNVLEQNKYMEFRVRRYEGL